MVNVHVSERSLNPDDSAAEELAAVPSNSSAAPTGAGGGEAQARAATAASDARFAVILAIADDAIISIDETQRITLFNRGAERVFGYAAREVIGQPLECLMPERFGASHQSRIHEFGGSAEAARIMAQRQAIFGRRKNGEEFPAEASISKLRVGAGTVFTVILRDISVRKAAELALQRAHDELELRVQERTAELEQRNLQLQQEVQERELAERRLAMQAQELARSNADLEQFASVASHDLQEPLRMVASYTQLLVKRYRGRIDADADEFMTFIVDGALRMQRLINDLLTFSRLGTRGKDFKPTSLKTVMQRVMVNLQPMIQESGAAVRVASLPTVASDETQMEMLLQNLVSNAIKFRGGEPPSVAVDAARQDGEWVISVADQGIGIDPKYAERIFVIFQRLHTSAEYPGTGIGLAICKKIVERHGGRIWVASEPGHGATFSFTLPHREEGSHEPAATAH